MLPTITQSSIATNNKFHHHHRAQHGKASYEHRQRKRPWALLVLLALATLVMAYTKHSSLSAINSAKSAFDTFRKRYLDLPELPKYDTFERTGSWKLTREIYDKALEHPNAQVLSEDNPRLILFPNFLSEEEAKHLIDLGKEHLTRSKVVAENENDSVNNARTSYGAWPPHDSFMQMLEDRIHRLLGVPNEFGEGIYVLNYKQGQEYKAHNDNCKGLKDSLVSKSCEAFLKRAGGPQCGPGHGGVTCGDRMATFILVLQAAEEGGHTVFPVSDISNANMAGAKVRYGDPWYCDAQYEDKILQAAPKAGDGILFWDYKPLDPQDTTTEEQGQAEEVPGAQHSGCPVIKGEKWIATRWIRSANFV